MSMAVGLAVLDVIKKEKLVEHAHQTGTVFLQELKLLQQRHDCIGDVRLENFSILTIESAAADITSQHFFRFLIFEFRIF